MQPWISAGPEKRAGNCRSHGRRWRCWRNKSSSGPLGTACGCHACGPAGKSAQLHEPTHCQWEHKQSQHRSTVRENSEKYFGTCTSLWHTEWHTNSILTPTKDSAWHIVQNSEFMVKYTYSQLLWVPDTRTCQSRSQTKTKRRVYCRTLFPLVREGRKEGTRMTRWWIYMQVNDLERVHFT